MDAIIQTLFKSDLFEIKDFVCQCTECGFSGVEYQDRFSICYIRRGSFLFSIFKEDLECFNGRFLLNKPGYTHRVKHYHTQPDQCFIISFSTDFYNRIKETYLTALNGFLKKADSQSLMLNSFIETEYIIYRLRQLLTVNDPDTLEIEGMVLDLIEQLFISNPLSKNEIISENSKISYLPRIEKTKEYIQENFSGNITIDGLAEISCMSPFHFYRTFKRITQLSPYQYLLNFRINHAEYLLRSTDEPITSVGWLSGFNSPDHFSYAFKATTGTSPINYRKKTQQEF